MLTYVTDQEWSLSILLWFNKKNITYLISNISNFKKYFLHITHLSRADRSFPGCPAVPAPHPLYHPPRRWRPPCRLAARRDGGRCGGQRPGATPRQTRGPGRLLRLAQGSGRPCRSAGTCKVLSWFALPFMVKHKLNAFRRKCTELQRWKQTRLKKTDETLCMYMYHQKTLVLQSDSTFLMRFSSFSTE